MFPPKPLDIFSPEGGCLEGLDAFRFFLKIECTCGLVVKCKCVSLYQLQFGGRGGVRCQTFSFSFFPCSADHERDWPPCKVVFFGLATNALNVRNNNNNNNVVTLLCSRLKAFRPCGNDEIESIHQNLSTEYKPLGPAVTTR